MVGFWNPQVLGLAFGAEKGLFLELEAVEEAVVFVWKLEREEVVL